MADNEVILDKDVRRIAAVRLVPRLGGPWDVYYEVVFVDGRIQQRPLSACACPDAISAFEGRYFASAHRNGLPGARTLQPDGEDAKSESIGTVSHYDGSDVDDRHLDNVPSDDSLWESIVDSQGRSATSPTVRAAIRAKASAPDETFRTPSKDGIGDSTDRGSSSKSSASASTAKHGSATKSNGSVTTDSLMMELAEDGDVGDGSPIGKRRPIRNAAFRGIALRRYATRRHLALDGDLSADDDDSDATGFSPEKNMAKLQVKDEVVDEVAVKQEVDDPWGGQKAADPWTAPNGSGRANVVDGWHHNRPVRSYIASQQNSGAAPPLPTSKLVKSENNFGVVGGLFADYFASQKRTSHVQVKGETFSDDDNIVAPAKTGTVVGVQRKRPRGPRASSTAKDRVIQVVTLSDDEEDVPRVPAKKSKKREKEAVVYVLSSDSDDLHTSRL